MIEQLRHTFLDGGKPPPLGGFKRIYNTPDGLLPKLRDVALYYGMFESNVYRRYVNSNEPFEVWHFVDQPNKEQQDEAIDRANLLYLREYEAEDNCDVCYQADNDLFKADCWLTNVDHDHTDISVMGVTLSFLYKGKEYEVDYADWILGERPHER